MSALADIEARPPEVSFTPKSGQKRPLCAKSGHHPTLGARYRQNRHDLHGFSREGCEVRMPLEQLGSSVV